VSSRQLALLKVKERKINGIAPRDKTEEDLACTQEG
jgi:hypothetical protein